MKIIALLDGGLGNKFNCLFTAISLSELFKKDLHVNNVRNNYSDFDLRKILDIPANYTYTEYNHTELDKKIPNDVPIFLHKKHFNYNREIFKVSLLKNTENSFIYLTDKLLIQEGELNNLINKIKINENILNDVNNFISNNKIDEQTLGIHIRCTDSKNRSENISDNLSLIELNKNKKIFVCTDEKEIKEKVLKYKNVVCYDVKHFVEKFNKNSDWRGNITDSDNRQWNYNVVRNENSTIEAFIELLILSRTNIITKNENNFSVKNISSFLSWANRYKNYIFKP